ncbi:MAG TPA: succinylglutamate desuccinylase/aspartoacylase family protein [Nocardioidaceae bacterium]|nr:succinylglutamate desuccinylase/aspartoacylase family protein [Nocardioidaceae bacterium]
MPTRQMHTVPVTTLANGHELELTVHTVTGEHDGPRLGMVASIHGDEPMGVETIRRLLETVTSEPELAGTITAVPVANPYAHMALTRNTPLDGVNLNRIFPGSRNGSVTEQIAHTLCELFIGQVDYLIDFHSGGNLACVDYAYIHDDDAALSKAYGTELLYRGPGYAGSFGDLTRAQGIPTVVSELGGGSQRITHYLDQGVRGGFNVLRHLGMVKGEPDRPDQQRVVDELVVLQPRYGGLLLAEYQPESLGLEVPQGTPLGRVLHPHTFAELEVIRAPFDPSILVLTRPAYTTVAPGDYGFMVANGGTAQPA